MLDVGNASVLHWNGVNKPWHLKSNIDRTHWLSYLQDDPTVRAPRCVVASSRASSQAPNQCIEKLPRVGKYIETETVKKLYPVEVKTAAMANWVAASMNDTWRDFDLLKRAEAMVASVLKQRPQSGLSSQDLDKAKREMRRSLAKFRRVGAGRLVGLFRAYLDVLETPHRCDFVLVALLGGRVYVDVSAYAQESACGAVPPEGLINFLYFFAVLTERSAAGAVPLDDVVFLVCTSMSTGKTTPHAPVLLYAKRKGLAQPGILVPGPAFVTQELDRRSDHEPMSARSVSAGWLPDGTQAVYSVFAQSGSQAWDRRFNMLKIAASETLDLNVSMGAIRRIPWRQRSKRAT